MGKFGDLWVSGRLVQKNLREFEKIQKKEIVDLASELAPGRVISESSRQILNSLQPRRNRETANWLKSLAAEALKKSSTQTIASAATFNEAVSWMNLLFKQFIELAFEFNQTVAGTDLLVFCHMPEEQREPNEVGSRAKSYKGYITTRTWALALLGNFDRITITVLPVHMLLAFTVGEINKKDYPPFMEVLRTKTPHGYAWTIAKAVAPEEIIPRLAKELFGDLIRVSSAASK